MTRSRSSGSELEQANALALRVLAHHARSEAQLALRLRRAGFEAVAAEVVGWARRLGYLDDEAYARGRARALLASGRAGPRLAALRLEAAGIPREDARRAVDEALAARGGSGSRAEDEVGLCRDALTRKLRGAAAPGELDPKARARLARFLLGRGFSGEAVARVLRTEEE